MAKQKVAQEGPSFLEAVEAVLPQPPSEFVGPFGGGGGTPGTRTVSTNDAENPYNVPYTALEFTYHHEVFVIYRPWWECERCNTAIATNKVVLPDDSDIVCPHTRRTQYLDIKHKMLNKGYIRQIEREETLKDGTIQISLAWMVPIVNTEKLEDIVKRTQAHTSEDPT